MSAGGSPPTGTRDVSVFTVSLYPSALPHCHSNSRYTLCAAVRVGPKHNAAVITSWMVGTLALYLLMRLRSTKDYDYEFSS